MMALSLACGIAINDWDSLTLGQIAEVILQKIKLEKGTCENFEQTEGKTRAATQADWDRLGA